MIEPYDERVSVGTTAGNGITKKRRGAGLSGEFSGETEFLGRVDVFQRGFARIVRRRGSVEDRRREHKEGGKQGFAPYALGRAVGGDERKDCASRNQGRELRMEEPCAAPKRDHEARERDEEVYKTPVDALGRHVVRMDGDRGKQACAPKYAESQGSGDCAKSGCQGERSQRAGRDEPEDNADRKKGRGRRIGQAEPKSLRSDKRKEQSAYPGKRSNRAELIKDAGGCYAISSAFFSPYLHKNKRD